MNADYLMAVASSLTTSSENSLGPTDSALAASSLRIVAALFGAGPLDAMATADSPRGIRQHVVNLREVMKEAADTDAAVNAILGAYRLASGE